MEQAKALGSDLEITEGSEVQDCLECLSFLQSQIHKTEAELEEEKARTSNAKAETEAEK